MLKAIESSECVGDSEKARLGNTTFLELTFPNSGCRSAATLWLFRSETRVNFAFWLAHPTHPFPAVGCGSGSARAVDFSIFSVVLCTPQEFLKRFGEYPHEIAGPRDSEMLGENTTACTFCAAQR